MINISGIEAGYVIDHIASGKWRLVYDMLQLDKVEGQVAIITHANSSKYGKKDIIKVEGLIPLNLDLLGFLDHNITVAVVKDGKLVEKKHLSLPQEVVGVATCHNSRCITSEERGLKQIFVLRDREKRVYRCKYCEEKLEDFK